MSPITRSVRLNTAYAMLDAYSSKSAEAAASLLDESFTQRVLPTSLNEPTLNKESWVKMFSGMSSMFNTLSVAPQQVLEDAEQNTVMFHAVMTADFVGSGSMTTENIMILKMSGGGDKIVELTEFRGSPPAAPK